MEFIGFLFFLIVVGGIISLIAIADPGHRRSAPRVAFPIFYAGVFATLLSFGFEALISTAASDHRFEGVGFVGRYLIGMMGGALLGYRLALRHRRHLINTLTEADDIDDSHES